MFPKVETATLFIVPLHPILRRNHAEYQKYRYYSTR